MSDARAQTGASRVRKKATEEDLAQLQRFHRDVEYYNAHYDELLAQYPEMWISIYNEAVVGAAPDLRDLLRIRMARGVPPGQGLVKYLTRERRILVL
jgi:hypothetical protein